MRKTLIAIPAVFCLSACVQAQVIPLGGSANAFSTLRPQQTQVYADPNLNTIVFIHRQDPVVFGEAPSTSGKLRCDLSTDGGNSWITETGPLNAAYLRTARNPNIAIYNPPGNTDPLQAYTVWMAATLSGGNNFDGHVNGTSQLTAGVPVSTENYLFQNSNSGIPGSLTERVPGEFWSTEVALVNDTATDTVFLLKGLWNSGTENVDWAIGEALPVNYSVTYDLTRHTSGTNVAFSPDGQTGYVAFVGDVGTADTIFNVVYSRTTDGGLSWGPWTEVDPNSVPGLLDSAMTATILNPQGAVLRASSVTTGFDFDLTVDAGGNPHFFTGILAAESENILADTVVGSRQYSGYVSLPKAAWDIFTTDGGTTWRGNYVSQLNAYNTIIQSGIPVETSNFPQIARTADGTVIFYSWTDTDTLITGPVTENTNPNLRVAGYRIADGFKTCYKRTEEGISIGDRMYTPAMAPVVLQNLNGADYTLPIVVMDIVSSGDNPVDFYYMGKITLFCDYEFVDPATLDLSWHLGNCYAASPCILGLDKHEENILFSLYPNPVETQLNFHIKTTEKIGSIYLADLTGRIVRQLDNTALGLSGEQNIIDVSELDGGIYLFAMNTSHNVYTRKFVIHR